MNLQEKLNTYKNEFIPLHNNPNDILNSKIYGYEIKNCISELDTQKAIGEDEIHNLMLKKLSLDFINVILIDFFNLCLQFHVFPDLWN